MPASIAKAEGMGGGEFAEVGEDYDAKPMPNPTSNAQRENPSGKYVGDKTSREFYLFRKLPDVEKRL